MRTRFKTVLAVAAILMTLLSVGTSSAQITGLYLSAYTGYVAPDDMNVDLRGVGHSFDLDTDQTGIFGAKIGWTPPILGFFAMEVDVNHIFESNYGPTMVNGILETGDIYMSNVFFNVLLRAPVLPIRPFAGAGIGSSSFHIQGTEIVGGRPYTASEDDLAFAWQFLAGVEMDIMPFWSIDLTYRYFGTDPSLDLADVEYRASIFTVGFSFRF